ncbi:hypothetical protein FMN50_01995 [Rhodobacterales bacterium]|nr:hypothetical protein FMN50_01995 [Rhodobacterales bacterium]
MTRRSRRRYVLDHKHLDGLQAGRKSAIEIASKAEIGSPAYQASQEVVEAIDTLAGTITGSQDYFHGRPATTPPSEHPNKT